MGCRKISEELLQKNSLWRKLKTTQSTQTSNFIAVVTGAAEDNQIINTNADL